MPSQFPYNFQNLGVGTNAPGPSPQVSYYSPVLGASTSNTNQAGPVSYLNQSPTSSNAYQSPQGAAPSSTPTPTPNPASNPSPDNVNSNINSTYDNYARELDSIMGGLDPQRQAQEGIVQNQYQQGYNTLTTQKEQGARDLAGQRTKAEADQSRTFKELAEAMRNQFMSGQVMLGTRGAGDSSAANQYAYALTKAGNEQRGDLASTYAGIQNDINDKEFKLNTTYNSQISNLDLERDSRINEIATQFADAQNQIRMLKAEGTKARGVNLTEVAMNAYQNAVQQANMINQEFSNRRLMLDQWAANKSNNIAELKANLQGISDTNYQQPAFQGMNQNMAFGNSGTPGTSTYGGGLFGNNEDKLRFSA